MAPHYLLAAIFGSGDYNGGPGLDADLLWPDMQRLMAWGTKLIGKKGGSNGATAIAMDYYSIKANVLKLKWTSKKTFEQASETAYYGASHAVFSEHDRHPIPLQM